MASTFDLVVVQTMGDIYFISKLPCSRLKIILCYNKDIYLLLLKLYPEHKIVFASIRFNEIFIIGSIFSALRKVRKLVSEIKKEQIGDVYIFSNGWDWITPTLANRIGHTKAIQFLDIYENTSKNEAISVKATLKAIYCSVITGVKFEALSKGKSAVVTFHNVEHVKRINTATSDLRFISKIKEEKVIIVLDSPPIGVVNYISGMNMVTKSLKQCGFKIYLKPHPRLKNEFKNIDVVLPYNVPMEFIDIRTCVAVLGICSAAMYNNNCTKNLSIVSEFDFENEKFKEDVITILKKNKVEVLKSLNQWLG